jgi:hypothetical protein
MPPGEEMFKYHGYSGDCPKPPLPKQPAKQKIPGLVWAVSVKDKRTVSMMFDTNEQANDFVSGIEAKVTAHVTGTAGDNAEAEIEYRDTNGKVVGLWTYGAWHPDYPYQG